MIRRSRQLLAVILFSLIVLLLLAGASCSKPKNAAPPTPPPETFLPPPDQQPEAQPSPTPALAERLDKLSRRIKNAEMFPADENSCRELCKSFCPPAAKCRIGPFAEIQKCKPLCFDPCMKGVITKSFVECGKKATDCQTLRECAKEYVLFVKDVKKGESPSTTPTPQETAP